MERRLAMPQLRKTDNMSSMLSLYNLVNAPLRTQGGKNEMEQLKEMMRNAISKFLSDEGMTYEELIDVLSCLKEAFASPIFNKNDYLSSIGISLDDYFSIKDALEQALGYKRKKITRHLIRNLNDLSERLEKIDKTQL